MKGIVWILVVAIIAIVGYLAYTQGYFNGADDESMNDDGASLEVNVGGNGGN